MHPIIKWLGSSQPYSSYYLIRERRENSLFKTEVKPNT